MDSNALMERRVERGTQRGALTVLADAQAVVDVALASPQRDRSWSIFWSFIAFHLVISIAVLGWGLLGGTRGSDPFSNGPDRTIIGPTALTSTEPLPAPILVDGQELYFTSRPSSDSFDADDLFGEGPPDTFSSATSNAPFMIFGDPDQPFDGPIFGVTVLSFDPVEFEVFSANMEPSRAEELAGQVQISGDGVGRGGDVSLATETGLVEIFDRVSFFRTMNDQTWEFRFGNQTEGLSFIASTSRSSADLNEWVSIYDTIFSWDLERLEISSIEVLGQPGVRFTANFEDSRLFGPNDLIGGPDDEISGEDVFVDTALWTQDEFTYTLNLFEPERSIQNDLSRLRIAERAEWNTAVAQSDYRGSSTSFTIWTWPIALVLFGFLSANWKRPRTMYPFVAGALGFGFALLNYWLVANIWLMIALTVSFGLLIFWAGRTKLKRLKSTPTPTTFQLLE